MVSECVALDDAVELFSTYVKKVYILDPEGLLFLSCSKALANHKVQARRTEKPKPEVRLLCKVNIVKVILYSTNSRYFLW